MAETGHLRAYRVVFKGQASARFRRPTDSMTFAVDLGAGPVSVKFKTRFTDEGLEAQVPRELVAETFGPAASLDDAVEAFGGIVAGISNMTAFATNAAIGPMELYVAVDASPGLDRRAFRQQYGVLESGFVQQGRAIPATEVARLVGLLTSGEHLEDLATGVLHYVVALSRWRPGGEHFVLNHLYTAAEALEKTVALQEAAKLGVAREQLHEALSLPMNAVGPHYRRTVVFRGDAILLEEVKAVSDGFEHGSLAVPAAQALAADLTPRLFRVLRESILERAQAPRDLRDLLLGDKYGLPLDPSLRTVIDGEMLNLPNELGPVGFDYPFLSWERTLARLAFDDANELGLSFKEKMTVHTADGGSFRGTGMRMYGRPADPTAPPIRLTDVEVKVESGPLSNPDKDKGEGGAE